MSVLSAQFPTMMTMPEIFTFCWDCIKNLLLIENLLPCANLGLLLQHLPNPFSVSYVDLIISECTITCIFHQSPAESDPSNLTSSNLFATRYLLLNLKFKFQKTISTWKSHYVLVYDVFSIQWVYRFCKTKKEQHYNHIIISKVMSWQASQYLNEDPFIHTSESIYELS